MVPQVLEGEELLKSQALDAYCLAEEAAADRDRVLLPGEMEEADWLGGKSRRITACC